MLHEMLLRSLAGMILSGGLGDPRPITDAESTVAIYVQNWELISDRIPKLILVAWPDGHVVWSEDRVRGGAPYLAGEVSPARVAAALNQADRDGAFGDKRLAQPCFGPDAKVTTILVKKGPRQLKMASWHELAEAEGGVVARACALMPLANERRLEALRKEPAEYLYYRVVWSELRELASSLIPSESRPVAGEVVMQAGVLSWRELTSR